MTLQSPRIYTYKITFEEVPYYYYGVHKEKKFDEKYLGSPVTHKWCWDFYTPKKQILQLFDFTDEGWLEANEIEQRIIKPIYNNDKWCLNGNCGGVVSLKILRETGKKVSEKYSSANGKKGGKIAAENNKRNKIGIFGIDYEQKRKNSKIGGKKTAEIHRKNKTGLYGFTTEERRENVKITNSQKWECCITGYVSTAAGVVSYQKGKGIDTSKTNRRRIA